ncbi:histone deacetylase RPD3 [Hysterangium stoloniferum]|nr:histone deacetylase RPD3 [Hysterangium stoloniferum]
MPQKRVSYFYDPDVGSYSYGLGHPMKPHRIRMTHDLVSAYGMLNKMKVLRPRRSRPEAMTLFHTDEYIDFLYKITPETIEDMNISGQRFLTGDDNPAFEGVFEFCSISAGGSVGAAERINNGEADIAINWAGGLHHAKKREASGFCYINDIVLAILELLRNFSRVLYIDIDCHHGDGVEEAFYTTDRVLTCSFHKFGDYFPGTGHINDIGMEGGLGYSVNVPLKDGLTDNALQRVFIPVIDHILEWYRPSAVVLQCGADSLAGDKLGCFNVTMEGHAVCVQHLRKTGLPLILLGGGGYTTKNVARAWTYETACALGIEDSIDRNLPWNDHFEWFGPRYRLEVPENNMDDLNERDSYLDGVREVVMNNLHKLPFAPSVAIQEIPSHTIAELLGLKPDDEDEEEYQDEEDDNDLDARIQKISRRAYEGRIEVDSPSASEAEDVNLSDSETTSSSGSLNRRPTNSLGDRYSMLRSKRKFFRSSLLWDPEQSELRGTIAALYCGKRTVDRNSMANGWSN